MPTVSTPKTRTAERTPQRPCASDCGVPEHHNLQTRFECHGFAFCGSKKAINKCEAVVGIRNVYDYLIHDTEDCRKKGKEQYDPSERITGNNFDIGAYEQLGTAEKNEMFLEMGQAIREHGFTNYMDFYEFVVDTYEDMNYIEVMRCYSGHFERMTRGNYQRWEQGQRGLRPSQAKLHENSTNTTPDCCPACGSVDIVKSGKTLANTQRWACKDCGRGSFEEHYFVDTTTTK